MKKYFVLLVLNFFMMFSLSYGAENNKTLIAYFSWAENTVVSNPSSVDVDAVTSASVLLPGNVTKMAGWIQEETGGLARSVRDIREVLPNNAALETNVIGIYRDDIPDGRERIRNWLRSIGY